MYFKTAISFLVISNYNSFRVRFDKIAWKKHIYILAVKMATARGTGTVPSVSAHFLLRRLATHTVTQIQIYTHSP